MVNEIKLTKALNEYHGTQHPSIRGLAMKYEVAESTLRYRIKGRQNRRNSHYKQMSLSKSEEKALYIAIKRLETYSNPPTLSTIQNLARIIIKNRKTDKVNALEGNEDLVMLPPIQDLSIKWARRFVKAYSLKIGKSDARDIKRIQACNIETFKAWVDKVYKILVVNNVDASNIYNVDETGFSGITNYKRKVVYSQDTPPVSASSAMNGNVTAVECICADGTYLNPLVIFKSKHLYRSFFPDPEKTDVTKWMIRASETGWITSELFNSWIKEVFNPETMEKASNKTRVLVLDGHSTHLNEDNKLFCLLNNIILLVLPAHTSHKLQPLDLTVFGPLKRYYGEQVNLHASLGFNQIRQHEFMQYYFHARSKALKIETILSGFRTAGLCPFSSGKIYSKLDLISDTISTDENTFDDSSLNISINTTDTLINNTDDSIDTTNASTNNTDDFINVTEDIINNSYINSSIDTSITTSQDSSTCSMVPSTSDVQIPSSPINEVETDIICHELSSFVRQHSSGAETEKYLRFIRLARNNTIKDKTTINLLKAECDQQREINNCRIRKGKRSSGKINM